MNSNIIGISIAEEEMIVEANETFLHMTGYTREDYAAWTLNRMDMTAPEYMLHYSASTSGISSSCGM